MEVDGSENGEHVHANIDRDRTPGEHTPGGLTVEALEARRVALEARRERLLGQVDALTPRYEEGVQALARLGATPETAAAVLAEVLAQEARDLEAAEAALTEAEAAADLAERLYREVGL